MGAGRAMSEEGGTDSIVEFVDGDFAAARQLRTSLRVLADHYAGEPLGRQIAQVLDGQMAFRELSDDPEFAAMAHTGMRELGDEWQAMSATERADLVRRGEAAAVELRKH